MIIDKCIYDPPNSVIGNGTQSIKSIHVLNDKVKLQLWHGYDINLTYEETVKLIGLLEESRDTINPPQESKDYPWMDVEVCFAGKKIDWTTVWVKHIHDLSMTEVEELIGEELQEQFKESFYKWSEEDEENQVCTIKEVQDGKSGRLLLRISGVSFDPGEADEYGRYYIKPHFEFDIEPYDCEVWPEPSTTQDTTETPFEF